MRNRVSSWFSSDLSSRLVIALMAMALLSGCGRSPQVTSPESLDFIKEVYTACNTRSDTRLTKCEAKLAQLLQENKLGEKEAKRFQRILELAKKQEWDQAQESSLQFARDQVK